ncbi:zinc finger protein 676-like [Protopterus annectens]|uniref:zinc finger protein 676-like n=1 Tax=Protopterus annectens TaxID=7888 RepID=UPI001CF9D3DF|nr:zinc finger protein 676-like [Protopterus annectens]
MQNPYAAVEATRQFCGEHKQRLELFCQEDETFICVLCVPTHSSHSFVFLHEVVSVYKEKMKMALASLELKVKECKAWQSKQEKEMTGIQEDAFSLEQYIKQEFAKLHQFLQDKEQKLIQQLRSDEANNLSETGHLLDCIKDDIIASHVSDVTLKLKHKEVVTVKEMEEKFECFENDVMSTQGTFDSSLKLSQKEPGRLQPVAEAFENVTGTFPEKEHNMLKKQNKDLYREVLVSNYEIPVSEGTRSTECNVSCSHQPSTGTSQLLYPTENLQQCGKPMKGCKKSQLNHVIQRLLERNSNKSSECDTSQEVYMEKNLYKCTECGKGFTLLGSLLEHNATHTDEKPTPVEEIKAREKPYKCTECSKCFAHLSFLQRHQVTHTGEKPYKCPDCSKSFTALWSLRYHQAIHTGQKPYECEECNKCFINKSHLKYHQSTHKGDKPYKCTECSKCFTQLRILQRHLAVHTRDKPHKCTECGKSFKHLSSLQRHQVLHTM